jgi:apolipoprotein N-acyltransferase
LNPASWPLAARLLLALCAGGLSVLGFAPFGLGLVPLFTLALLFHLWRHAAGAGAAAWTGYAFGLGLFGFGVSWIRISIAQFGGVNEPLAVTITALFVLFMAGYLALAGWAAWRLRGASPAAWVAAVTAVWVLVEWLRGWLLTGFPWLAIGYSQIDLPLAGYGPVLGVYGISLMLALSAALLGAGSRVGGALMLLLIWGGGFVLQQLEWARPVGGPIQVSLLQGNIPQAQKWLPSMREPSLRLYREMTAAVPDSRIVIWPETAVPAFDTAVEETLLRPLHAQMRAQRRDLLLGIVAAGEGDDYHNAMLSLGASGRGRYDKRHLVPFGEYLPFDRWTRPVLDFLEIPMSDFSPGAEAQPLIELAGHPVGVDICYEDAYGEEIIRALPQAALLINASNDAWFGDSLAPHQHLEIARMRALETGRYLLRATNTGVSAIIDERGRILVRSPQFERATLTGSALPLQGVTPFVRWGNHAVVLLALLMSLAGLQPRRNDTWV